MQQTVCQECGERVVRDAEFCPQCGIYLDWTEGDRPCPPEPAGADPVPVEGPRTAVAEGGPPGPAAGGAPLQLRVASTPADPPRAVPAPRTPLDAAPADPTCPRCAARRATGRRFCATCAYEFDPPTVRTLWTPGPPPRRPWWRRIIGGRRTAAERSALRAYRRSLPLRHRLFRVAVALLVAALAAGAALAVRRNPVDWLQDRWYDLRGTVVDVAVDGAALDPATARPRPEFGPSFATDEDEGTAWATVWTGGKDPVACGARRAAEALQLTFADVVDLRAVEVLGGLPSGDSGRSAQPRPRTLELRFSDGTCQLVHLRDVGRPQREDLDEPVSTSSVRIAVVDVFPADGDDPLVAISEIEFLSRPRS